MIKDEFSIINFHLDAVFKPEDNASVVFEKFARPTVDAFLQG